MCRGLVLHGGRYEGQRLDTQGVLAAVIGQAQVVVDVFEAEVCLCVVDVPASARLRGWEHRDTDPAGTFDPFDWHWYPVPSPEEVPHAQP